MNLFLILVFFFGFFSFPVNGAICFPTPTPFIFGTANGDTLINSFYFKDGHFLIGGSMTDPAVIGAANSPSPFAGRLKSGGS
jgi:hypothetical protein